MGPAIRAWINYLIENKWAGKSLMLKTDEAMEQILEVEKSRYRETQDIFEKHYKYRQVLMIMAPEWIKACEVKELNNSELVGFDFNEKKILISMIRNKVYATDRICTHAYADLSTGFMNEDEETITCPLHMSSFKLEDGTAQNLPAEMPLKTYKTKIQNNSVYILVE